MPRGYRHIKEYEKEILELKEQGMTLRSIGEKYGFTYDQVHNFISRHNERQRKLAAGIAIRKKGRPPKEPAMKKRIEPASLTESEREELIRLRAENEYIKAENEIIKKEIALREERQAALLKAKKQRSSKNSVKKDIN